MRNLQSGRLLTLLGAAAFSSVMLAGSAVEADAQTADVIYACYVPGSGVVYRVEGDGPPLEGKSTKSGKSAKDGCKSRKHVLYSWNAEGPEGPAGPMGSAGADGSDGAPGPAGPIGPAGAPGADGADGTDGAPGPAGPVGPTGPAGAPGADGADGAPGAVGPVGPIGPTGPTGPQGVQGVQGARGPTGLTGPQGPNGVSGYQIVSAGPFGAGAHSVSCPSGKRAVGGGYFNYDGSSLTARGNRPINNGSAWEVDVLPESPARYYIYAICIYI